MPALQHERFAHLLAALLVAIWPAGIARACCCAAGSALGGDGGCQANCCCGQPSNCCAAEATDTQFSCCDSASHRDACGCLHGCEMESHRRDLGIAPEPSRDLAACLPTAAWPSRCSTYRSRLNEAAVDEAIVARPVRILYGVWRN